MGSVPRISCDEYEHLRSHIPCWQKRLQGASYSFWD